MKLLKHPWKNDARSRRFSHKRFYGKNLLFPDTLNRPRRTPENQLQTTRCAAYAGALNGGYIHGRRMSPDWQAKKIGQIQGTSVDGYGSDPNAAMQSQMYANGGYLPYEDSPVTLEQDGILTSGNMANYAPSLDAEAQNYADEAYLKPDGGQDYYDSICDALITAYDSGTKLGAGVQAFSGWYDSFMDASITSIGTLQGYHSYLFIDFVRSRDVLILENSYGTEFGNGGYQEIDREVVNALFSKQGTSLKIPKQLTATQIALAKQVSPMGKIQDAIIQLWYDLSNFLMRKYGL